MFKIVVVGDRVSFDGSARVTDYGKKAGGAAFVVYVGPRRNHSDRDEICHRVQRNLEEMLGLSFGRYGLKSDDLISLRGDNY